MLDRLFPNGLGTRAILAFGVVGVAIAALFNTPDKLYELALIVLGFYFVGKASANGNYHGNGGDA